MLKIDKDNYGLYKKVYEIFWQHHSKLIEIQVGALGLNSEFPSPLTVLNNIETQSKAHALKSLKSGFFDTFNMMKYAPEEFKKTLDESLKANGLPGYFTIYAEVKNQLPSILKRGSLSSTEEYYFVIEFLSDTTLDISADERAILNNCVLAFEQKQAKKN